MGKLIKRGIIFLMVFILNVKPVYAEKVIEIKIPDEIKLNLSEGDFDDYTEIPRYTITDSESLALQKIAVAEAQNTNAEIMAEIMLCVLNRVCSDKFPNSVTEVIEQKGQFSTYPNKYNKSEPNELSKKALELIQYIPNREQLYFENTKAGSWQSTHLEYVFNINDLYFYK